MPNPNMTELVFIIDRSGSMSAIQKDAAGGLNHFLAEQKKVPGLAMVTLVQFDTIYETVHENKPLHLVPEYVLEPRGGTALLDAIGQTISNVGARLSHTPDHQRPGKVVVIIVTDGEENSSHQSTREQVFAMIKHQQEKYSWEFLFLAANQDAIAVGASYGIRNSMNYQPNSVGVQSAYSVSSNHVAQYRNCGTMAVLPINAEDIGQITPSATNSITP